MVLRHLVSNLHVFMYVYATTIQFSQFQALYSQIFPCIFVIKFSNSQSFLVSEFSFMVSHIANFVYFMEWTTMIYTDVVRIFSSDIRR